MTPSDSTPLDSDVTAAPLPPRDFRPTASLSMLRLRAHMLDWIRRFFHAHGYWEVETPLLSHDVCVDVWLEPFRVPRHDAAGERAMYLQTSPEFGMKRLLAAGAESIFQITRAFRQEETGRLHNPEFTIVEWYRVGDTYRRQMEFVEELAVAFQAALRIFQQEMPQGHERPVPGGSPVTIVPPLSRPFRQITYEDAFMDAWGEPVLSRNASELAQIARERGIVPPRSLRDDDRNGWLNLLFLEIVEPLLEQHGAVLVSDYPDSQAALARIRADDPPVAERFELYLYGIEICNGYQELTDPSELRRRIAEQFHQRNREGRPRLPTESRLLAAMEHGLPACAGVALGFDRLLMALLGAASLDDVMAFPFRRA